MKKLLLALAMGLFATATYAQNCNIGIQDTTGLRDTNSFTVDYLTGLKFTLANSGTLNSLNLISRGSGAASGGKVRMVVYADNNGVPGNWIASTDSAAVTMGLNTLPVTATTLAAGSYWVMALYNIPAPFPYYTNTGTNPIYYTALAFNASIPTNGANFTTYNGGNIAYFMGITCATTGVETMVSANNINIYPNPAKDLLTLQTAANMIGQNYVVIDQLGRQVLMGKVNNETSTLDISQLQAGMYFLKVGAQSSQSFKFVKE